MPALKEYLGDGAYAEVGPGQITITTENGISVQNTVVLDTNGLKALVRFAKRHGFLGKEEWS